MVCPDPESVLLCCAGCGRAGDEPRERERACARHPQGDGAAAGDAGGRVNFCAPEGARHLQPPTTHQDAAGTRSEAGPAPCSCRPSCRDQLAQWAFVYMSMMNNEILVVSIFLVIYCVRPAPAAPQCLPESLVGWAKLFYLNVSSGVLGGIFFCYCVGKSLRDVV